MMGRQWSPRVTTCYYLNNGKALRSVISDAVYEPQGDSSLYEDWRTYDNDGNHTDITDTVIAWAYPIAPYDGDVPKKEKP